MNFDFYNIGIGFVVGVLASYFVSDIVFAHWFKKD